MIIQILVVKNLNLILVIKSTLAGISVAIVSGGAAEKITFLAWSIISIIYSGFVYPAIVHWTTSNGW